MTDEELSRTYHTIVHKAGNVIGGVQECIICRRILIDMSKITHYTQNGPMRPWNPEDFVGEVARRDGKVMPITSMYRIPDDLPVMTSDETFCELLKKKKAPPVC